MYFDESQETEEMVITTDRLAKIIDGELPLESVSLAELLYIKSIVAEVVNNRVLH